MSRHRFLTALSFALLAAAVPASGWAAQAETKTTASVGALADTEAEGDDAAPGVVPCTDLPSGELSDDELARLVAEDSPGKVRVRWKTESQEECYGFNIYRAPGEGKPFGKINTSIIPGEGSTNIPKEYCYEDRGVERGKTYFYYIEEISNSGVATKLEATMGADGKGTRVKVKTVPEEREWLKKKAAEASSGASAETGSSAPQSTTGTASATAPASSSRPTAAASSAAPAPRDPLQ